MTGADIIRLWTIQNYAAYDMLLQTGKLTADENHLFCERDLLYGYDWMTEKMKYNNLLPQPDVHYPIWAWYQWEGKRKRRDMRESGHAQRGEKIVQLTIEINEKEVLLSDFDLFHYVLNYWYLPINETDANGFEREYTKLGFDWHDLKDASI